MSKYTSKISWGAAFWFLLAAVGIGVFQGFIIMWAWQWFVITSSAFASLHLGALSLKYALGLGIVGEILTSDSYTYASLTDPEAKRQVLTEMFTRPFIVLLFAFIIHLF